MTSFTKFDASEFLGNEEVIKHYLDAAREDGDPNLLAAALTDVAKARRVSRFAAATEQGPGKS